MKNKLSLAFLMTLPLAIMFFISWYVGLFSEVDEKEIRFPTRILLLRSYQGEYLNGAKLIQEMQKEFLQQNKSCRPILMLLGDDRKVHKLHLRNKAGCICEGNCPTLKAEQIVLKEGTFRVIAIKAHPVYALAKILRYLRQQSGELMLPLIMESRGSREHWIYSISSSIQK
ncbi:MAG: hypothetical protein NZM25_07265 [Leptospiraceae bacterium]|nr:hypothetical protein [Leptospiraceae bacterium]MDW8307118.1 hypothetical protein [Leptospiraceae bacterium]